MERKQTAENVDSLEHRAASNVHVRLTLSSS